MSITHPSISFTELSYLDGVTSNIQTQLNTKVVRDLGARALQAVVGSNASCTTAQFITWLNGIGAFSSTSSRLRFSWDYAGNNIISDIPDGTLCVAGSQVDISNDGTDKYTITIITPNSYNNATIPGGSIYVYNTQGTGYISGWRRVYTSSVYGVATHINSTTLDSTGRNMTLSGICTANTFDGFGGAGVKNLIHNPMLEIHQRGNTTLSPGPHTKYICDRWWLGLGSWSGVNITTSVEQDNRQFPNTTLNVRAITIINPGTSTYFDFIQTFDEYWRFTGRTMTISFSYGTNVTTANSCQIIVGVRVNGTWKWTTSTTFTPTNGGDHSWTFTWPPYETGMDACQFVIRQNRTTSGVIWLSRVQLEEGTTQTPFEYKGFAVELLTCNRYYQTLYAAYAPTAYHGGTTNTVLLQLPTPMRIAPLSHTYFDTLYGGRFGYRDFADAANQVINPSYVTVNNYNSTSVTLVISNGPFSFLHNLAVGFYADI